MLQEPIKMVPILEVIIFQAIICQGTTVDGRNPAPLGMYKTL